MSGNSNIDQANGYYCTTLRMRKYIFGKKYMSILNTSNWSNSNILYWPRGSDRPWCREGGQEHDGVEYGAGTYYEWGQRFPHVHIYCT